MGMSWTRLYLREFEDLWSNEFYACTQLHGKQLWIMNFLPEVEKWLDDHAAGGWLFYVNCDPDLDAVDSAKWIIKWTWTEIAFRDPAMAVLFKLTWG